MDDVYQGDLDQPAVSASFELEEGLWLATQSPSASLSTVAPTATSSVLSGQQTNGMDEVPSGSPPLEPSLDVPDMLRRSRWTQSSHHRLCTIHPQYCREGWKFFHKVIDCLLVCTSSRQSHLAYTLTCSLHSDAILLMLECCLHTAVSYASCFHLMVKVLLQHLLHRCAEFASKHVVHSLALLHSLLPLCEHNLTGVASHNSHSLSRMEIYTTSLYCLYLHRASLRRSQNAKCLAWIAQMSLLVPRGPPFAHLLQDGFGRSTELEETTFHHLERSVFTHLLMRYVTTKDKDIVNEYDRDYVRLAQLCVTHCWHRISPCVNTAALLWIQKHKRSASGSSQKSLKSSSQAASTSSSTTDAVFRATESLLPPSVSPKSTFLEVTRITQETGGFGNQAIDRALLNAVRCSRSYPEEKQVPSVSRRGVETDSTDSEDENSITESLLQRLAGSSGKQLLRHVEDVHWLVSTRKAPSSVTTVIVKAYPSLASSMIMQLLYREWPAIVFQLPLSNSSLTRPSSEGLRVILSSLWIGLRHVNVLEVTRALLNILPSLSTAFSAIQLNQEAAYCRMCPVNISAVIRCVTSHIPLPLVRLVLQQILEERELTGLPLHPAVLILIKRLLDKACQHDNTSREGSRSNVEGSETVIEIASLCKKLMDGHRGELFYTAGEDQREEWWDNRYENLWAPIRRFSIKGFPSESSVMGEKGLSPSRELLHIHSMTVDLELELRTLSLMAAHQKKILLLNPQQKALLVESELVT